MQTSVQELEQSHPESFLKPLVKVEKRLDLYMVIPLSSVEAMQATTNFLWTSIPQQMGYMIFNNKTSLLKKLLRLTGINLIVQLQASIAYTKISLRDLMSHLFVLEWTIYTYKNAVCSKKSSALTST